MFSPPSLLNQLFTKDKIQRKSGELEAKVVYVDLYSYWNIICYYSNAKWLNYLCCLILQCQIRVCCLILLFGFEGSYGHNLALVIKKRLFSSVFQ